VIRYFYINETEIRFVILLIFRVSMKRDFLDCVFVLCAHFTVSSSCDHVHKLIIDYGCDVNNIFTNYSDVSYFIKHF